jgi:hypothetical protein
VSALGGVLRDDRSGHRGLGAEPARDEEPGLVGHWTGPYHRVVDDDDFEARVRQARGAQAEYLAPSMVVNRAGTLLRMVRLGLAELETAADIDRILWGLLSVAVFGRSVTWVMQSLRTYDEAAFNAWYARWEREMAGDPLLAYFNVVRRMVIHYDRRGPIGVVMGAQGCNAPPVGSISIEGVDIPQSHLGRPITDTSARNLCRLYADYLGRMFEDFAPVAFGVQDRRPVPPDL